MMRLVLLSACATSASATLCCYTEYIDDCKGFPSGHVGGLCNKDYSTTCVLDDDCGSTPPAPVPTPGPAPPAPTPSPSGSGYPFDKIRFAGRWYAENGGMVNGWGQSIFARFTGTSSVSIKVNGNGLYYTYRIDNGPWKKILVQSGQVLLTSGLSKGDEHTLHFGKSDEASYGTMTFQDLVLDHGFKALDPGAPKLTFEAIGDSITAGFKVDCHPGGGSPSTSNEDQYETYVAHIAEAWGTDDWSVVARSGVGAGPVVGAGGTILEEYKCQAYSATSCSGWGDVQWDFSKESRQPDVVAVNIGTNDYAFGNPSLATFKGNYKTLLSFVRSKHPKATIFSICPLQYSLNGPLNRLESFANLTTTDRDIKWQVMRDGVRDAVKELGDSKIHYIATSNPDAPWMDGATEFSDWTHPTVDGHAHLAKLLLEQMTPIVQQDYPSVFQAASPVVV